MFTPGGVGMPEKNERKSISKLPFAWERNRSHLPIMHHFQVIFSAEE